MHRKIPSLSTFVGLSSSKHPPSQGDTTTDKGETSESESERKPRSASRRGSIFARSRSPSPAVWRNSGRLEKDSDGEEDTDTFGDVCPNNAFVESEEDDNSSWGEKEEELEKNTEVRFTQFLFCLFRHCADRFMLVHRPTPDLALPPSFFRLKVTCIFPAKGPT
jgi:hypothetical protein